MKRERVLVTGGAGFIGAAACARFAAAGHGVRVLDDLSTGRREHCDPGWELCVGDVADAGAVADAVGGCDVVVHLAALVSVPESFARSADCARINVDGTRQVRDACRRAGVERLVFGSSCATYAAGGTAPLREDAATEPASPYARSKLAGEALVAQIGAAALRFFNVYGPRQPAGSAYAAAVPNFVRAALRGEALTIYGDGQQSRDFVYVEDVADAIFAAAFAGKPGVFNVGTGKPVEIAALAQTIVDLAGTGAPLHFESARPGDVRSATADVAAIRAALGWRPRTALTRGLEKTLAWWRAQADGAA